MAQMNLQKIFSRNISIFFPLEQKNFHEKMVHLSRAVEEKKFIFLKSGTKSTYTVDYNEPVQIHKLILKHIRE